MAVQHGVDNMAAIGAQHAAVIAHRFAGGARWIRRLMVES